MPHDQDQSQRTPNSDEQAARERTEADAPTLDKDTLRDLQAPVGGAENIRGGGIPKRPTGGGDAV